MKIAIDARLLERPTTGIGRILTGILDFIPQIDKKNEYFLFSLGSLENYKNKGFINISTGGVELPPKILSPIWLNFILPKYLKKYDIDLFFSPTGFLPLIKHRHHKYYKSVIVICDAFHKINKKFHPFLYRKYIDLFLPSAIKKSNLILTISESSKRDIMNFYKVPGEKIKVVHLAADKSFKPRLLTQEQKEYLIKKYNLPPKFILYTGVLEERKNIGGIIKMADLIKEKTEIKILLFGRIGHRGKEYLREIKKRKNIQYKGFVEGTDLPYIYNLATIFFFPPFYEGFGLPVLEAIQSGLPVVASNTSSLPEVIGNGGIMREPNDYEGFTNDILNLLENKKFYDKMRKLGVERAKNFSWKKTTKEIIKLFNWIYEVEK